MRLSASSKATTKISRRRVALLLSVSPLAAQVASPPINQKTPPVGTPAAPAGAKDPVAKLQKAVEDVRQVSQMLSKLEVPMDVEPAFQFKP
jgi:hypothetical protein